MSTINDKLSLFGVCTQEKFGDTKEVIRNLKSKKNKQHNGEKKRNKKTNNDLQNTRKTMSLSSQLILHGKLCLYQVS